ncbi:MAG: S-ribosylhomocysteine lyase [Clostridia bacterium]|nr:S-ribosylhomocysteine lyase [Clostridia bacterium]
MEKIKSFQKDHNTFMPGFYFSNEQNGVSTFDLRFKRPNEGDYIDCAAGHSVEHLLATILRNSDKKEDIIYFGPMGCRTGFYLLTTNMTKDDAKNLLIESLKKVQEFDYVPGAEKIECGNYLEHDLDGAKKECAKYLDLLLSL